MILKGNEIEGHVIETRSTRCHVATSLTVSANLVLAVSGYDCAGSMVATQLVPTAARVYRK